MQLAGSKCVGCGTIILLHTEGTWCARCQAPHHISCARPGTVCAQCHQTIDPPEAYFVYSQICPECFRPNTPPKSACERCGAVTRWDTKTEYESFRREVAAASRTYLLHGLVKLVLAVLCGGIVLCFIFLKVWIWFATWAMIVGGFIAAFQGGLDLINWSRSRRFR